MNGIIIIDKPSGKTSHDVVENVRKALSVKKAGHTGTLDPIATGVLPVCINEATKLVQFFSMDTKDYTVTMLMGVTTDTQDIEGNVITRSDLRIKENDIENAIYRFVGKIQQMPPRYSAIKFKGKALYKWARKGIAVEPLPRSIEIYNISIDNINLPYVTFSLSCSKGTYVRSLCSDVGKILGCGACMASLRRTRSGNFSEKFAVSPESVASLKKKTSSGHFIPLVDALPDFPMISVNHAFAKKLKDGYQPVAETFGVYHIPSLAAGDMVKIIDADNNLISIAKMLYASEQICSLDGKTQVAKNVRIFNNS